MRTRCYNSNYWSYYRYGARGIRVCPEWKDSLTGFRKFTAWATSNGFYPDLTIDRINNDGNYTPENCRWIPFEDNIRNRVVTEKHSNSSRISLAKVNRAEVLRKAALVTSKPVIDSNGRIYPSGQVASLSIGANRNTVGQAIRKGHKTRNGLSWRYL